MKIQGIALCLVSTILGSLLWPFELGAVVKYLSFSIHIMIRVNTLLNQITYLSIFKINKMPKTMNSVMFFNIFLLISSAVY